MRHHWWLGVILMVSLLGGTPAAAQSSGAPMAPDRVDQMMARYNLHPAFEKLGRGVANALLGWLEVPLGVHERYAAENTAPSMLTGMAVGTFKGAVRMAVGVYETVTFLLPYPEEFRPILPTLPYFQRAIGGKARQRLPLE